MTTSPRAGNRPCCCSLLLLPAIPSWAPAVVGAAVEMAEETEVLEVLEDTLKEQLQI